MYLGLDHTKGTIVGERYKTGKLFYEGRPQGRQVDADTDEEVRVLAQAEKASLIEQASPECYRNPESWELRIWD